MRLRETLRAALLGKLMTDGTQAPRTSPYQELTQTPTHYENIYLADPPANVVKEQLTEYFLTTPGVEYDFSTLTPQERANISMRFIAQNTPPYFVSRLEPWNYSAVTTYDHLMTFPSIAKKLNTSGQVFPAEELPTFSVQGINDIEDCPVELHNYIFCVIDPMLNNFQVSQAVTVASKDGIGEILQNHAPTAAQKLYLMDMGKMPVYGSAEVYGYSPNGNIGNYQIQSSTDVPTIMRAFKDVMEILRARPKMQLVIVYKGPQNKVLRDYMKKMNLVFPVFNDLEGALEHARQEYFGKVLPDLQLDANACPIGKPASLGSFRLLPYKCTTSMPIYDLSQLKNGYGFNQGYEFSFRVVKTNRRFELNMYFEHSNASAGSVNFAFTASGLKIKAANDSLGVITPSSSFFKYTQFLNQDGYYDVKIQPLKIGQNVFSDMNILVRHKGQSKYENVGYVIVEAYPREVMFCGFDPMNSDGLPRAFTRISKAQTKYINTELRNKTQPGQANRRLHISMS